MDFHVLKDINLAVEEGEFVSIMGKSGCGKSTLLYVLSTMDTDYEGELFLKETSSPATVKSSWHILGTRTLVLSFSSITCWLSSAYWRM